MFVYTVYFKAMDKDIEPSEQYEVPEHVEFQSKMPYMGLHTNELTVQEERFINLIASGMTITAAGRAVGYKTRHYASRVANKPKIKQALDYLKQELREETKFTRAHAHKMYMDTYIASANATEMKGTVDSLCKLHGLHQPDNATQVNINVNGVKQLERMSDEELLKIAGHSEDYLEPDNG